MPPATSWCPVKPGQGQGHGRDQDCHHVRAGRCQRVNPWIEFLVSHGGLQLDRKTLSETYRAAKIGVGPEVLIRQPYLVRWSPGDVDGSRARTCAFTRARQRDGKAEAVSRIRSNTVRPGFEPPGTGVRTVFLMLVHSTGVTHPELWQEYLAHQPHVAVCVHGDVKTSRGQLNTTRFFRQRLLATRVTVEWGKVSVVEATIQSMKEVLRMFPGLEHVVLCSGSDIPIQRVDKVKWLHAGRTTFTPFYEDRQMKLFTKNILQAIPRDHPRRADLSSIAKAITLHSQWVAVCRDDVAVLVRNAAQIMERFEPLLAIMPAADVMLAPDEYYLIAAIRLYRDAGSNVKFVQHTVCGAYIQDDDADHPVTFRDMNTKHDVDSADVTCGRTNLRQLLNNIRRGRPAELALTMRKIDVRKQEERQELMTILRPFYTLGRA